METMLAFRMCRLTLTVLVVCVIAGCGADTEPERNSEPPGTSEATEVNPGQREAAWRELLARGRPVRSVPNGQPVRVNVKRAYSLEITPEKRAGDSLEITLALRPGFSGPARFFDGAYGVAPYTYDGAKWSRADDPGLRRAAVVMMLARPGAYASAYGLPARDGVTISVTRARSYRVLVPFSVGNRGLVTWADS